MHRGQWPDRVISTTLFMLYSLPTFWIQGRWQSCFCVGGGYLDIFPPGRFRVRTLARLALHQTAPGLDLSSDSARDRVYLRFPRFLSRQMRSALLEVLGRDYIRTARAKEPPAKLVIWKHAFRNSLIPIITLLASIFPGMISGSVILESIFSIQGMGFLSYGAMIGGIIQ